MATYTREELVRSMFASLIYLPTVFYWHEMIVLWVATFLATSMAIVYINYIIVTRHG